MIKESIVIIGFGYAGLRFFKAISYLNETGQINAEVVGICDLDPLKRSKIPPHISAFPSFEEMLANVSASIVVITVNEFAHFDILNGLTQNKDTIILCEKPLTINTEEMLLLAPKMRHSKLSLNLVERFSPIVTDFFNWKASTKGLEIRKVETYWGKFRIFDPRPTMGVLTEVIHPIDLIDHLFGFDHWKINNIFGIQSDFSVHAPQYKLESIDFIVETDAFPIRLSSSFAWSGRRRNITAMAVTEEDHLMIVIDMDIPKWDCDTLSIYRIDTQRGRYELIYQSKYDNNCFSPELGGINKVAEYIRRSILHYRGVQTCELVDYEKNKKLQNFLGDLENALLQNDHITSNSIRHAYSLES